MAKRLTKSLIDTFEYGGRGKGRKDIRWDSDITGFGIRLYPSGKKSFILSYRQHGTKREYTIGQYGKITLDQARLIAKKKFGEVADGKDPVLVRKALKKKHEWTVRRAFNDFLKKHAKTHTKTWPETKRIFEKDILPAIGRKPIDEVKKEDILKILDKVMGRKSGIMANRTLSAVRKFFNWCIQRDLIEHSPAYMVAAPAKRRSRDRVLSDQELKEIWYACDDLGYPFGSITQFLILTGQRRGEVVSMRWENYDEEARLWIQPRERTKSDREHAVPLSDMAVRLISSVPKMGPYIFTSSGSRPFDNFSRGKDFIDAKLKIQRKENRKPVIQGWTIHDLRRTVASGMARLKVPPHIIEKTLNHATGTISGVAAVYNRYEYIDEREEALNDWADYIEELLEEEDIDDGTGSRIGLPSKNNLARAQK